MNKSDLIKDVQATLNGTAKEACAAVDAVLDAMGAGIVAGGLELQGFGNFKVKTRAERTGRNPRTGESITIAAKQVIDYSPASKLTKAVNGAA